MRVVCGEIEQLDEADALRGDGLVLVVQIVFERAPEARPPALGSGALIPVHAGASTRGGFRPGRRSGRPRPHRTGPAHRPFAPSPPGAGRLWWQALPWDLSQGPTPDNAAGS